MISLQFTVSGIYHPDTVDVYTALRDQVKPRWVEKRTKKAQRCIIVSCQFRNHQNKTPVIKVWEGFSKFENESNLIDQVLQHKAFRGLHGGPLF